MRLSRQALLGKNKKNAQTRKKRPSSQAKGKKNNPGTNEVIATAHQLTIKKQRAAKAATAVSNYTAYSVPADNPK